MNAARPVLAVRDLTRSFGDTTAVAGLSFSVAPGEIVGLLGPNGAGKTTTLSMVLGVLAPTSGSVEIDGLDVGRERVAALARTNFAAVHSPLPGNLTVAENLRVFGMIYGVSDLGARLEALLEAFDLVRFRKTRCGVLSSGEQTRVGLAKAFLNEPRLLLLDEPTASLDPASARDVRERIRARVGAGSGGVLWTSHNMGEVVEVCDRVLFLSRGRLLLEGDPRRLPAAHGVASLEELFVKVARTPFEVEE